MMRSAGGAVVAALALLLSGCSGSAAQPTPTVTSRPASSNPTTALEAQARSVWSAYFSASNELFAGAATDPALIKPYVTAAEYEVLQRGVRKLQNDGRKVIGSSSFRNFQALPEVKSGEVVAALVCIDSGTSRIVDATGKDVTPPARKKQFTLRLGFMRENGKLLLDTDETWTQLSVC